MAGISSAVVTTITAEKPSARNATPSGGAQPPTKYCNTLRERQTPAATAIATASPTGITARATRSA